MNNSNKPLLKQFSDLTKQDFENNPLWIACHIADYDEPWYDETDEEIFRPFIGELPMNPSDSMYLVKASFILADGTKQSGFFTPQNTNDNEEGISYIQPCIFIDPENTPKPFWFGMSEPPQEYINRFYSLLNKEALEVFPISYSSDIELIKGGIKGKVNGFGYIGKKSMLFVK